VNLYWPADAEGGKLRPSFQVVMKSLRIILSLALLSMIAATSGCVTKRTVTQGGQTVESGYVVKRPIKEAIQNTKKAR